jgi:hypothetical protein
LYVNTSLDNGSRGRDLLINEDQPSSEQAVSRNGPKGEPSAPHPFSSHCHINLWRFCVGDHHDVRLHPIRGYHIECLACAEVVTTTNPVVVRTFARAHGSHIHSYLTDDEFNPGVHITIDLCSEFSSLTDD